MNFKKLIATLLFQLLAVAAYFFLVRPFRGWYGYFILENTIYTVREWPSYLNDITLDGITLNFFYTSGGNELVYSYAPQFGFFFLLAVVGMIFFRAPGRLYLFLSLFHLLAETVALGSTWAGVRGFLAGFIIADFILLYLSPLISLGFVFIAHQISRKREGLTSVEIG